ncbi:conserved hypothetical protein [Echinococcus multilocularis]|uniref:Uncharacterized protein n=1 Tax=Echinococcus multilocularis TaxID=6211 RepID=A0A087W0G9_ECHMU|nr:conserved hypothetical protein [Echinococcus multilocularis]
MFDMDNRQRLQVSTGSEPKEWRLETYRCFRESEAATAGKSTECRTSAEVSAQDLAPDGIWFTRRNHNAAPLALRLSDYAHLVILQGSEIVESYFLILAKKWIKMVIIEDELMLYIRGRKNVRRLRLTFPTSDDARSCYHELARYVSVKLRSSSPSNTEANAAAAVAAEEEEQVARWLSAMMGGERSCDGEEAAAVEAAWHTNWPTEQLVELVKLCLLDANFPGFVRQVQQCLCLLTTVHTTESMLHDDRWSRRIARIASMRSNRRFARRGLKKRKRGAKHSTSAATGGVHLTSLSPDQPSRAIRESYTQKCTNT